MAEFGWTYLSRKALRQAESQLSGDAQGVRDEIGFLLIHQHYADRFFPGTSVLQTRLRYALFIPWMFQAMARGGTSPSIDREIAEFERKLCGRLVADPVKQHGVIGGRTYPRTLSQPPSTIYWTALSVWGLLRHDADSRIIGKRKLGGIIQANRRALRSRGEFLDEPEALPFDTEIPPAPASFEGTSPLSFDLTEEEKKYLWGRLGHLRGGNNEITLLGKIVQALQAHSTAILGAKNCWDSQIFKLAGNDQQALRMAQRAAAITAIGRGIYAALVEQMRNEDRGEARDFHQMALEKAIAEYRLAALELDVDCLEAEVLNLPVELLSVLRQTKEWLNNNGRNVADLYEVYEAAESKRKRLRARLSKTENGRRRRNDWNAEKNVDSSGEERADTEPLHYRWHIITRLLRDLHGED